LGMLSATFQRGNSKKLAYVRVVLFMLRLAVRR